MSWQDRLLERGLACLSSIRSDLASPRACFCFALLLRRRRASNKCRYIGLMPLFLFALLVGYFASHASGGTNVGAAAEARRTHSPTLAAAFDSRREIDAAFGWNNFRALAPYLDIVMTGPGDLNTQARKGGLKTMLYLDMNLCSGRSGAGANRYAGPDCADWPASAFYTQDGYPDRVLTASYNGWILQRVGDPASPEWPARAAAAFRDFTAHDRFELIEIDDATAPDEFYGSLCWGAGRVGEGHYECAIAPGGSAHPPFGARYSRAQWQAGEAAIARLAPSPVVFNGLQGYDKHESLPAIVALLLAERNAWGAMCDTCFYGTAGLPNPFLWTHPILDVRLNAIMQLIGAGKNAVVINGNQRDPSARARALADIMLAYDPDRLWQWGSACGSVSMIHACPEAALTFYSPYRPYPKSTADLVDKSGNYVREFRACYDRGRYVGPCAAVVNPDLLLPHGRPALQNVYRHRLEISGTSLCNCYGDSGSISENGPPVPAIILPASGYVLFR